MSNIIKVQMMIHIVEILQCFGTSPTSQHNHSILLTSFCSNSSHITFLILFSVDHWGGGGGRGSEEEIVTYTGV